MKVALVAPPYFSIPPKAYGGVEAVVADLADALVARGHDVTLLCAGPSSTRAKDHLLWDAPQPERLGEALIEVVHAAAVHRAVAEIAAAEGLDVVHDHTLTGALLAPSHPVPTVLTCHGPMLPEIQRLYRDMAPQLGLVAISHRQRELAPGMAWLATVHNAVRAEDWPMRTTAPADGEFALFLGRLHPDKAPHLALDAAHAAGLPVVLAGKCAEPIELEYLEREVRPRLRDGDVLFGMADAAQKRDLLTRARCLLMPIVWEEPFGMVLIESMVCGTPVVALRAGAVPEIVVDGVTGFVCDDLAAFTAAIGRVGRLDPRDCRQHAVSRFGVERMAAGYELAYAAAMVAAGRAPTWSAEPVPALRTPSADTLRVLYPDVDRLDLEVDTDVDEVGIDT
jgi:glycosyltransferase involved in cell wall biosynthesis